MAENNANERKYIVSSTPHIRSGDSVDKIMLDVLIALLPATICGIIIFGMNDLMSGVRAATTVLLAIASSMFFERYFFILTKKPQTKELSAAVTGLLLAMNLPPTAPFWMPIVGSFVAIVIVKQLFGGLGQNFMNPALCGRAFLLASYPTQMTTWTNVDAVSSATPLAMLKQGGFIPQMPDYINAFIGNIGGCIGETAAFALILGGLYLIYKKVITWHIPATYIGTVFVLSFIFGRNGLFTGYPFYEILIGGLMLGAFYMATDYSSSPITSNGRIIMGVGCGILTVLIRVYGGYPEGVSYSILLMNLAVPIIDRYTKPKVFGVEKMKGAVSRG